MKKNTFPTVGAILLIIGCLWLAKDLGWITVKIPFWPILLIVLGLAMVYKKIVI